MGDNGPIEKQDTLLSKEKLLIRISSQVPMKDINYYETTKGFVRAIDTAGSTLPKEVHMALVLYKNGVKSNRFASSLESSGGLLKERDKNSLLRVTKLLKALEESNPTRTTELQILNNKPEKIGIYKFQEGQPLAEGNNIILERTEEGELKVASETYQTSNIDKGTKSIETNKRLLENIVGQSIAKYKERYEPIEEEVTYDTSASYHAYVQRIVSRPPEARLAEEEPTEAAATKPQREIKLPSFGRVTRPLKNKATSLIQGGLNTAANATKKFVSKGAQTFATSIVPTLAQVAAIGAAIGMAILTVILWTILMIVGFVFFAVIILFIINSGAYIVPPGGFTQRGENAYIRVVKTADPSGPFDNSWNNQSRTINYTVTIYALQGSLTDISFNYTCSVISDNQQRCPDPSPNMPPSTPSIITATEPFVITYHTVLRAGGYYDSLITDTFTVTATTNGEQTTASGSRSIVIGTPPLGCFEVAEDFPDSYASVLNAAIASIVANHPGYVAKLCDGGTILIGWGQGIVSPQYCGWHVHGSLGDGVDIYLNANCLQDPDNAEFIVGHESGHHLASVHPEIYALYESSPAYNDIICSYPDNPHPKSEDFAEMIGMYINDSTRGASCFGNDFCNFYPLSCQFARGTIFSE